MLITGTLPASITLRTIAPFLFEGTCLLVIFTAAVLLASPFVSNFDKLFSKDTKLKKNKLAESSSTTNYPSFPHSLPSVTNSVTSLSVLLDSVYPTRVNTRPSGESIVKNEGNSSIPVLSEVEENFRDKFYAVSSNGCKLVSYNSYRHKLIEETLQKQYGGGYAPGNVILNLIQLNTADSKASLILSKKYDISFFDHILSQEGVVVSLCNSSSENSRLLNVQDIEFPDPLDHFIPRNMRKPSTIEMHTETANPSEISIGIKSSVIPSARPNTPTSCQRINSRRSREASYATKSPFPTPVHSQAPLKVHGSLSQRSRNQRSDSNSPGRGVEAVNLLQNVALLREQAPLTEQLFRRNDTRPDVVSRTHVDAEEYLNRIANNKRNDIITKQNMIQEPRIRSSLKKSRKQANGGKKSFDHSEKVLNCAEKTTGDCDKLHKRKRDNTRNLSTSKPTIWNN